MNLDKNTKPQIFLGLLVWCFGDGALLKSLSIMTKPCYSMQMDNEVSIIFAYITN